MALEGTPRRSRSEGQHVAGGCWVGWRALVFALVLLLGAGGGRDVAAAEKVPAFPYEQYSDAQGHFKYDGAALELVKQSAHLKQVYEEAAREEDVRAKVLVSELEYWFRQAGLVVADTTTRPACLGLKEMTPACQPNWKFLTEFLGDTPEAQRLRHLAAEAKAAQADARAAGQSGVATRSAGEAVMVGEYKLTRTVASHLGDVVKHGPFKGELARPYLTSPLTLQEVMAAGKPIPDPGGVAGALRWDVPGRVRGAAGMWELVIEPQSKTILHWLFKPGP